MIRLKSGSDRIAVPIELAGRERLDGIAARKQPAPRQQHAQAPALPPPVAQQLEQLRRQNGVAVPRFREGRLLRPLPCSTRSSMRSESISPTLSATTSETRSPAPYAMASAALYFGPRRRLEQQRDLLEAQHGRQPARFAHDREPSGKVRSVERHGEEETQGRDRAVDARRLHAGLRLVQLEAAQILRRRRVGRPADEGCERPHVANVVAARLLGALLGAPEPNIQKDITAHVDDDAKGKRAWNKTTICRRFP